MHKRRASPAVAMSIFAALKESWTFTLLANYHSCLVHSSLADLSHEIVQGSIISIFKIMVTRWKIIRKISESFVMVQLVSMLHLMDNVNSWCTPATLNILDGFICMCSCQI